MHLFCPAMQRGAAESHEEHPENDRPEQRQLDTGTAGAALATLPLPMTPFIGIPPSARHLSVQDIACYRVRNGKIVEEWPGIRFPGTDAAVRIHSGNARGPGIAMQERHDSLAPGWASCRIDLTPISPWIKYMTNGRQPEWCGECSFRTLLVSGAER